MANLELKEFIAASMSGVKAEIEATNTLMETKFNHVIERMDQANHRTSKLEQKTDILEDKVSVRDAICLQVQDKKRTATSTLKWAIGILVGIVTFLIGYLAG